MSTSAKMILVLTIITILSGGILSSWDAITKPKIEVHRLRALKKAISEVLPPYNYYDELVADGITFYIGREEEAEDPVAIAFKADGSGFQGNLVIMIGVSPDFKTLTGIKILEQIETPGLGTKIVKDPSNKNNPFWFPEQFRGVVTEPEIGVVRNQKPENPTDIQAVSGATITSKAVVRILNDTIQRSKLVYQKIHTQAK